MNQRRSNTMRWTRGLTRGAAMLAALALVPNCAANTDGSAGIGSNGSGIVGGTRDTGDPAVMVVFSHSPGQNHGWMCSASLIAPNIVLTAAHCVTGAEVPANPIFEVFTASDITQPLSADQIHAVASVHPHPLYDARSSTNDVAIVLLSSPITDVTPLHFLDRTLPSNITGQNGRMIGYGDNAYPAASGSGVKRQATSAITGTTASFVTLGNSHVDACFGDSGGPLLANIDGVDQIIGVSSNVIENSDGSGACHLGANYTRVDSVLSFIHQFDDPSATAPNNPSWSELSTLVSSCNGANVALSPECASAYHRYCRVNGYGNTGFGPNEKSLANAKVTCLDANVMQAHFSDWDSSITSCNGQSAGGIESSACASAVHRWCRSQGFATGFGPVEHSGDNASVACLTSSQAQVIQSTYTTLRGYHAGCDGTSERWGGECNAAIDRLCMGRGAVSGFGPVENSGDNVTIVCTFAGSAPSTDPCAMNTDCASCTLQPSCGWCANTGTCASGTQGGPNGGACSGTQWSWLSTSCPSASSDPYGPH